MEERDDLPLGRIIRKNLHIWELCGIYDKSHKLYTKRLHALFLLLSWICSSGAKKVSLVQGQKVFLKFLIEFSLHSKVNTFLSHIRILYYFVISVLVFFLKQLTLVAEL